MATEPDPRVARLHDLLATLTEARFAASLTEVEQALAGWRAGDLETLVAHEAAVRHVERADAIMQEAMAAAAEPLPALAAASAPTVATAARPSKRAVADALLAKGPILVHLDARKPGVAVPSRFADEAKLVLRFGFGLSPPIADLVVDDVGIAGTLVFGGVPFGCVLPWTAIFALVLDGESRGMVWPEDAPGDLLEAAAEPSPDPEPDPEPPPRARRPSHLRLVD